MASTLGRANALRYRSYVYDRETGLYYLQSRYYNPGTGRFINADILVATGQGLLGNNMFAYCNNNPICYSDENGASPWLVLGIVVAIAALIGLDHYVAANDPDGKMAVHTQEGKEGVTIDWVYAKGNGFEVDCNGITLCDTEAGLMRYNIEGKNTKFVPIDAFTASATAELDWSGELSLDVSANASIYSPSVEVVIPLGFFSVTIEGEAYIGGAGVGVELNTNTGKFKVIPPFVGVGGSFGVDVDFN